MRAHSYRLHTRAGLHQFVMDLNFMGSILANVLTENAAQYLDEVSSRWPRLPLSLLCLFSGERGGRKLFRACPSE